MQDYLEHVYNHAFLSNKSSVCEVFASIPNSIEIMFYKQTGIIADCFG